MATSAQSAGEMTVTSFPKTGRVSFPERPGGPAARAGDSKSTGDIGYATRMLQKLRQWVAQRDAGEFVMLVALLVVVGGVWAFLDLAGEVKGGQTQRLDSEIIRSLRKTEDPSRPVGPAWMAEVGRDLTAVGGIAVLSLVTSAVVGFLLIRRQYGAVVLMIIAIIGGAMLSSVLKYAYDRPRPSEVPHLSLVYTSSFPSGHSMMSAVVYLTLGALLARFVGRWRLRIYCLVVAVLLTGLVGISRVYMGVHYPTDVLAGWTAGLVWATLCWLVARYLQYRRAVEAGE